MKIDKNDPRWTAYALGEIRDEKERAELEEIIQASEEIRRMVDEIRRTAELLNDGLKYESPAGLTEAQRSRIESQGTKRTGWIWSKPVWALSAAAAMVLLTVSVWMFQSRNGEKNSFEPGTMIAELHKEDAAPAPEAETLAPVAPEVKRMEPAADADLPAEYFTDTTGKSNASLTEEMDAGDLKQSRTKTGDEVPNVELAATSVTVAADTEDVLLESDASVGQTLPESQVKDLPTVNSNALDIIKVEGGVNVMPNESREAEKTKLAGINAGQVDVQRDGVTVNDVRHQEGMSGPTVIDPARFAKTQLVTSAVDAEMARRRYPAPPPPPRPPRRPDERRMPPFPREGFNTESYENIVDNPFMETTQNPLSTFSVDVDTASYSNVRRFLEDGRLPPKDAVRIEELVNYFDYDYKGPDNEDPFAAHFEMTETPWNKEHKLLRIGLKALEIDAEERPAANLVFLIDVSGSMSSYNKLPLVKDSLHMLVDRMTETDHVAIVTYAGSTRVALPSTRGDQKWSIHRAIDYLRSGGSTAGASGIQLAYETARKNFIDGGVNRVILATDGDFNVGITSHGELTRLIEEKAESGVFLTALGYGMGNYKDDTLELLAGKGRGNYAYIDTIEEAKKVLVDQINATLVSVAKDVKIQVEFNPGRVGAYRLIGYEDRVMPKEDFNDDTKKAGVVGAGHAVTALYEIVPAGKPIPSSGVDPLKYQKPVETTNAASSDEVATVKVRYKEPGGADSRIAAKRAELKELSKTYTPDHPEVVRVTRELEDLQEQLKDSEGEESRLLVFPVKDANRKFGKASRDFKFAASVAAFGMVLRDSPYKGSATLEDALSWAKDGKGDDRHGYRAEFIRLLHRAMSIKK